MDEIIRMAQEGNWDGIWLAFQPLILSLIAKLNGCGVEADDLYQEGNYALLETIQAYRDKPVDLQWLVLAIKRRVTQRMARFARKMRWKAGERRLGVNSYRMESSEAQRLFAQWVSRLEANDIFSRVLTDLELDVVYARSAGMKQEEIAGHLGVSPQTMGRDIAEIRRKMRLAMEGKLDEKAPLAETRGRKRKKRGGAA